MKNQNPLLHTPEGVRDIYGNEFVQKFELQQLLYRVLAGRGYQGIETPTFEFFDVFSREVGTVPSRELYKFFDKEGNTLVLRPDMTPSIARAVSKYFHDETPIRLCYMGNTFINYDKYQGRLKETTQMGAELMGDGSVESDVELLSVLIEALQEAGLREFQVSVGQVEFFKALLREAGIGNAAEESLRRLISDKNRFGAEELLSGYEISEKLRNTFLEMATLTGGEEALQKAKSLTDNSEALEALERLREIYKGLKEKGYEKYVTFDLSMLSKYNYYTGIIFHAYSYGYGEPLAKGGRYDNLLSHFGRELPAVGFAIVVDQLQRALRNDAEKKVNATGESKRYLTFALTKGRLAKKTLELLEKVGITCEEMKDPDSRKLIFVNEELGLKFFLAKGPDVPTYVEYGAADIGVVGKDTLVEEGRKMYEVLDLGFGKCRMCVCGPESVREKLTHQEQIRVATKYPDIAKDYFYNQKHQTVEIIKLNGSIELAPIVGLSDVIVDIVETGSTLRENGLSVLEEVMPLSARMVVNQVSMKMESERITKLIQDLRAAL
ncbi:ATP phosphoribosyltransferase regulatory subunit [Anaerosacchariphilus sp. NSJ-68]|uniref:Multifunctional fusion protein n=2 Tax=Lachnospiraceae TaxID=186803 RepID=A0A923RM26_9FIRM|nr:ATP phosphoribosyltransferase regulatory subunit [Anaerosacchariphilus hominis]MBC5697496.1 ATP phosphoribosyltransferase regulatory subunit [Roseburia difficilis]